MLKYLFLCISVLSINFIITSDETNNNNIITENTVIIGDTRFDFVDTEEPFALNDVNILSIEEDQIITLEGYSLQKDPIWNLDRIDQRSNTLNSMYFYQDLAGSGVWNYVLDTGIWVNHEEFGGRAYWGLNVADDEPQEGCMNPHGTHVAGTIGSKTYGVAKNTSLVSVKVLDCSGRGTISGIIKALGWVVKQDNKKKIINMSLGGGKSNSLDYAIEQVSKMGVVVVVAAGNENRDACLSSPSSSPYVITVGATTKTTEITSFSNWGRCVDIFAPGSGILSTMPGGKTSYMDGTSMSAPHVAGVVSLILDAYTGDTIIDYKKIKDFLALVSTKEKITGDLKNSPNNMLFSLASFIF